MRKILLIVISIVFFCSCQNEEDKMKNIVTEFLTEINDKTLTINKKLMTEEFVDFFRGRAYYASKDWILTIESESDSTALVKSKGKTHNGFGAPVETIQAFSLTNKYGKWKISDSYNLIASGIDFEVVDAEWDFYWDRKKNDILEELQEKVKIQIRVPGYSPYYGDSRKGKIRIINNSDYDIKSIKVLVEHFDYNGISVNTDYEYISDIIRKNSYRECEWYTTDCGQCVTQKFKISFIKEGF